MQRALDQLESEGHALDPEAVAHLSPAGYGHVNPYGKYRFDVERVLARHGLRPLRQPAGSS